MKANRKEKVAKVKAEVKAQVVNNAAVGGRQPVAPQASAYVAPVQVVQPWHKKVEVITVNQEKFNRAGFDMLMDSLSEGPALVIATATVEKKTVRARINDGFLGLTRRMYRAGKNGQEILEANVNARLADGYDAVKAMIRAKKDYGYVVREAKLEKKGTAATPAPACDVAVNA